MTTAETVRRIVEHDAGYEHGLDRLTVAPAAEVDAALVAALRQACAALFRGGWQPIELHRVVGRRGAPLHGRLIVDGVAAYTRGFDHRKIDPRWLAQADELGARAWWGDDDRYLAEAAGRWRVDRVALLDGVLGLLRVLTRLPPIEMLMPPPGTAPPGVGRPGAGRAGVAPPYAGQPDVAPPGAGRPGEVRAAAAGQRIDERLLGRVRALLAKAEATGFPAEAEAFAAKAQELIARHSLAEALADRAAGVLPLARRIGVDHPYEDEKAALLDAVARANRCETVWSPELAFSTVFGFDADIDAVELLYTSLLVQANRAMARDEPPSGKAARRRLKTFRKSFLIAYAGRIGERLTTATAAALQDAPDAAGLLPVLASREAQIREAARRAFPETVRTRAGRIDSHEGWTSGRAAADRATLRQ